MTARSRTLALALAVTLAACGDAPPAGDGGGMDATADTSVDAGIDAAACVGPALEDLEALGTRNGDELRYAGDNGLAPESLEESLQPDASCGFRVIRQRRFRYTMRSTAALRVSTNHPGTSTAFDTTLYVARSPCLGTPSVLACNDDDPTVSRPPHITASWLTTPSIDAGTEVFISVAGFYPTEGSGQAVNPEGELGEFELSVREVVPLTAGDECTVDADPPCPDGQRCVATNAGGAVGRCAAPGTIAGSGCTAANTCTAPLVCDENAGICIATVPLGGVCDRITGGRLRCATGNACISTVRGSPQGICTAPGTGALAPCREDDTCDAGLACREGICRTLYAANGPCNGHVGTCPDGQSCRSEAPGGLAGTCTPAGTAPGTACRTDAPECNGPLFCVAARFADRLCRTVGLTAGAACGTWGACGDAYDCIVTDARTPNEGMCTVPGTQGGVCREGASACDPGLFCTDTAVRRRGRCLRTVTAGNACDVAGRLSRCGSGGTCIADSPDALTGICRPAGTVAGAGCRNNSPRCAEGLTCSSDTVGGVCQRDALADGACDARFGTVRCPAMQLCRADSLTDGTCTVPTVSREPDGVVPAAMAASAPIAHTGVLDATDVDCVGLTVNEGDAVFAQATAPDGQCRANLTLDLYGPDGLARGTDADSGPYGCARIDGRLPPFPWARSLPAGRYTVCVRDASNQPSVQPYLLSARATR